MNTIQVSALYYYPIKSCRGIQVDQALVTTRGLQDDRLFMVVNHEGEFLTQREQPRIALIAPEVSEDLLTLRAPGMPALSIFIESAVPRRQVIVWRDTCAAIDQGAEVAAWLSEYLEARCRLVRLADEFKRRVDPRYAQSATDETSFSDGYPFLLISQASLEDLNTRLAEPLPMNRFRPNIVVSGCAPFAEDGWRQIQIGDLRFGVVKPCARCAVTTIDQTTAMVGKEPLTTLAAYRRTSEGKVMFGQNLLGGETGVIRVGDPLVIGAA